MLRLVAVVACLLAGCASAEDANPGGGADFATAGGDDDLAAPPDDLAHGSDGAVIPPGCSPIRHVVVNEVKTGGTASASDEFIELYNPCTLAVDLTGFSIVYRSAAGVTDVVVINLTKTIAANGYILVAGPTYSNGGTPDQTYGTGRLAAAGGGVGVRDGAQLLVDSVGYGSATNAFIEGAKALAPANGQSIARTPNGIDTDHNDADFAVAATPTPPCRQLTGWPCAPYRWTVPSLRAWVVVALAGVAATGGRAHAESAEGQVERLASEAVNAYKGADYNRAVELLQRAYEIRQVPALLYNMAKAYDKLGDVEHAYDAYRRYADSADADPKLKAKADARLVTLEEARRKKAASQRAVEPKPQPTTTPESAPQPAQVEAPKAPPPPTAEEIKEKLKEDRQRGRRRDRYVALGLGIGAVAFAGVAIGFSVNALQLQSDWSSQYGGVEATRRDLKDTATTRAAIADGFYAGTAVAAGVAAYFLYRGFRPEPSAPSLALVPMVSPAGGGLVATGRF